MLFDKNVTLAQMVKHLPTTRETCVQSLGWEDPLEKEMATHSSILARKIPWMEEPGGLQAIVGYSRKERDTTEQFHFTSFSFQHYNVIIVLHDSFSL